jgi:hypothetical protein
MHHGGHDDSHRHEEDQARPASEKSTMAVATTACATTRQKKTRPGARGAARGSYITGPRAGAPPTTREAVGPPRQPEGRPRHRFCEPRIGGREPLAVGRSERRRQRVGRTQNEIGQRRGEEEVAAQLCQVSSGSMRPSYPGQRPARARVWRCCERSVRLPVSNEQRATDSFRRERLGGFGGC